MRHFPVFFDLDRREVVAVGGGEEIAQKLRLVGRTGARLTVVSPRVTTEIAELARNGRLEWHARAFDPTDIDDASLVYVSTGDAEADAAAAAAAGDRGIPVNVIDRPELCTFYTPAIVDRDPVVVAIGTEGTAPVLARGLKSRIESMLPVNLGRIARLASSWRDRVADVLPEGLPRRRFWDGFFFGALRDRLLDGDTPNRDAIEQELSAGQAEARESRQGRVSLVGAGPGDPELLTLKARRKLQEADVIVYDRLVGPGILEFARRDAERISVGKAPGKPSPTQDSINAILVDHARRGRFVVRLKGGDPYIFGRGAEEQVALQSEGIPVDVVPGITAAAACAASVMLPLTTRGVNRGLTLLTGTSESGPAEHDWSALAAKGAAFAVYMGVASSSHIEARLLEAGIDPATPVTIVENGTLPTERCLSTTIRHLRRTVRAQGVRGPAIIYVGLHWPTARTAAADVAAQGVIPFPHPAATAGNTNNSQPVEIRA